MNNDEIERVYYIGRSRNMYGRDIGAGWFKERLVNVVETRDGPLPVWTDTGPFRTREEAELA